MHIMDDSAAIHTFHMQVSLSSNGHEKTKETSKFKKLLI